MVHGAVKSGAAISGKLPEWYMIHIPLLGIVYGKMCHVLHDDESTMDGTNPQYQSQKYQYHESVSVSVVSVKELESADNAQFLGCSLRIGPLCCPILLSNTRQL